MSKFSESDIRDRNDAADALHDNGIVHPSHAKPITRSVGIDEMRRVPEETRKLIEQLVSAAMTDITFTAEPGGIIRGNVGIVPTRELLELLSPETLRHLPEVKPLQPAQIPERSVSRPAAELRMEEKHNPGPTLVVDGKDGHVIGQVPANAAQPNGPPLQPVTDAPPGSAVETPSGQVSVQGNTAKG